MSNDAAGGAVRVMLASTSGTTSTRRLGPAPAGLPPAMSTPPRSPRITNRTLRSIAQLSSGLWYKDRAPPIGSAARMRTGTVYSRAARPTTRGTALRWPGEVRSCQEFLSADIVFAHVGKYQQAWHQNATPHAWQCLPP